MWKPALWRSAHFVWLDAFCISLSAPSYPSGTPHGEEELSRHSMQPQIDEGIKTKVREMIKEGTEFTDNEYIIEDVVFVDSRYRSMSQIVDCVAYVVRRYHRLCFRDDSNASEMAFYKECYDSIAPHIRRSNNGKLKGAGLKIYPKR